MSHEPGLPLPGGHVLIIEDEMIVGLDLQAELTRMGYASFAFASTDEQAAEQAALRRPDLATVDLGLLDGDGFSAARAVEACCGPTPILFITGDAERVTPAPGRVVLPKPFGPEALRDAVLRATTQRPAPV